VPERINGFFKAVFIAILVLYSGWLTVQNIDQNGYNDGWDAGATTGYEQGFKEGRASVCMVNPL